MRTIFLFPLLTFLNSAGLPTCVIAQSTQLQSWTSKDLMDFDDGQFRCPETLPTLAEKTHEMERFVAWTQSRYPNWTIEQIIAFRMAVLKHNACTRTLDNIQEAAN